MKYHRPTAKLALACLLFLVAALGPTPRLAGRSVEALPHTVSVSEKAVAAGPSSPAEMVAFLDGFFETKMAELHIPGAEGENGHAHSEHQTLYSTIPG